MKREDRETVEMLNELLFVVVVVVDDDEEGARCSVLLLTHGPRLRSRLALLGRRR